jgi:hypothetical protein
MSGEVNSKSSLRIVSYRTILIVRFSECSPAIN